MSTTFNGRYIRRQFAEDGKAELVIEISGGLSRKIIDELEKGEDYRVEMTKIKSKRTIGQNNLLWKLIDEIADKTGNDPEGIYCLALEKAGARYEYIAALPEAESTLRKAFRTVKLMNSFEHNGRTFNQYKAFVGSSKLNTSEMAKLLDVVMATAAENGIYLEEFET
jgi:hypothetical protein